MTDYSGLIARLRAQASEGMSPVNDLCGEAAEALRHTCADRCPNIQYNSENDLYFCDVLNTKLKKAELESALPQLPR